MLPVSFSLVSKYYFFKEYKLSLSVLTKTNQEGIIVSVCFKQQQKTASGVWGGEGHCGVGSRQATNICEGKTDFRRRMSRAGE